MSKNAYEYRLKGFECNFEFSVLGAKLLSDEVFKIVDELSLNDALRIIKELAQNDTFEFSDTYKGLDYAFIKLKEQDDFKYLFDIDAHEIVVYCSVKESWVETYIEVNELMVFS